MGKQAAGILQKTECRNLVKKSKKGIDIHNIMVYSSIRINHTTIQGGHHHDERKNRKN